MNKKFFYIFIFVLTIAMSYVVYAMYNLPKLGQNESVRVITTDKPLTFLS